MHGKQWNGLTIGMVQIVNHVLNSLFHGTIVFHVATRNKILLYEYNNIYRILHQPFTRAFSKRRPLVGEFGK